MEETSSTTLGDVFVIPALPAGSPPIQVTVDAFATQPDGMLFPSQTVDGYLSDRWQNYDTGLGVRVKSTGDWVGTDDDNDSSGAIVWWHANCLSPRSHLLLSPASSTRPWSVPMTTVSR